MAKKRSPEFQRVAGVLAATTGAVLVPAVWYALARFHVVPWPEASSFYGIALAIVGAGIIAFEMLMWPAKRLRGWKFVRVFGNTKSSLRLHVFLGFAVLPIIVIHSGFAFGGSLSALTMIFFLLVIANGVWGVFLQQWLPAKILHDIPGETIATQVDKAAHKPVEDAGRIVRLQVMADTPGARAAKELQAFEQTQLKPYLEHGRKSSSALASATESERAFKTLRTTLPDSYANTVQELEALADVRRQWDRQRRIHWWLHSWLVLHLPLSLAMVLFMMVHAVLAMKWW